MTLIIFLLACGQSTEKEDSSIETDLTEVDTAQEEPEVDMSLLVGTEPAEALEAPDFTALNFDGSSRSRDDLMGSPTVLWFYPIANTPG